MDGALDGALAITAVCAAVGLLGGLAVPWLIAWVPEPAARPTDENTDEPSHEADVEAEPEEPKELYADIAALPGLAWKSALVSAFAAGVMGLSLGWHWALLLLVPLAPVGVALALIDFRTWLLPTRIIWPTYVVVVLLGLVGAVAAGDADALVRGLVGTVISFVFFYVLWFLPGGGMGYGDVRLSTVLGFALAYVGWGELMVGLWAGFLLGALGWLPLRMLKITGSRHLPFGPFMLLGVPVGLALGPVLVTGLAA